MCEKSSTWYEDERSRILYTCEEKYDGNMVAYVIDLESQMAKLKLEQEQLKDDLLDVLLYHNADVNRPCYMCKHLNVFDSKNKFWLCSHKESEKCKKSDHGDYFHHFEWRGLTDQGGIVQI